MNDISYSLNSYIIHQYERNGATLREIYRKEYENALEIIVEDASFSGIYISGCIENKLSVCAGRDFWKRKKVSIEGK